MGDERISGAAKKVRGSITEALGKLTGDKAVKQRSSAKSGKQNCGLNSPSRLLQERDLHLS